MKNIPTQIEIIHGDTVQNGVPTPENPIVPVSLTGFERKMTNADRLRQMTDEELAAFLVHRDCKTCANNNSERMRECDIGRCLMYTEKWLKREEKQDET